MSQNTPITDNKITSSLGLSKYVVNSISAHDLSADSVAEAIATEHRTLQRYYFHGIIKPVIIGFATVRHNPDETLAVSIDDECVSISETIADHLDWYAPADYCSHVEYPEINTATSDGEKLASELIRFLNGRSLDSPKFVSRFMTTPPSAQSNIFRILVKAPVIYLSTNHTDRRNGKIVHQSEQIADILESFAKN